MITGILDISTNDNSDKDRADQTDVTVSSCAGSTGCTQVTYWPFTTQRDWTFIPCCFQTVQCGPVAVARGGGGGWGGGRHCPPRTSPHSFEEQPSLIINRHTKRWAPKQYGTDLFMGTSAGRFWATHRRSPLLFRYLHVSERRAGWEEGSGRRPQRICSTFPFSPFCKTGQF